MKSHEIKRRWLEFFERKGHTVVPSASLISEDPSLLFTVAGMVPFIPYLTGKSAAPYPRATSVQKCIRTLDIEEVGKTARHGTFFQMNGNFSFGDYFKKEAIAFAWELLTTPVDQGGYGLPKDRLWVTVYRDDDEAMAYWKEVADLPDGRIQRMGKKDNYWSTGQPGPAGPCSEIYYDRGPAYGPDGGPEVDDNRYLEIWNLVFMQYQRGDYTGEGDPKENFEILGDLPRKNIDTGLGMERLALILQGVENFYETDEVYPVLKRAAELAGIEYGGTEGPDGQDHDVKLRVVADHVRSALMLIADGVTPSNEGRGYVLRRLLRRAVRSMRLLGVEKAVLPELLPASRDAMKESYPEVESDFARISKIAYAEEKTFLRTIAAGNTLLEEAVRTARTRRSGITGEQAFTLHDTYGFPLDLTLEAAAEAGIEVDEAGFRSLMQEQKDRARRDSRSKKGQQADLGVYEELRSRGETAFTGYGELSTGSSIRAVLVDGQPVDRVEQGQKVQIVLDQTPFYAESGGQSPDAGTMAGDGFELEVTDVQRPVKGLIVHDALVKAGSFSVGADVLAQVDPQWRLEARQAHSGTHILHAALRQVLGPQATQSGSFNKPGYLRLDYSWTEPLSAETRSELEEVSNLAIRDDLKVWDEYMSMSQAKERGALALFGETYDETVRVVTIGGPWSVELCGGTHVEHSSQVQSLALVSEASVGSGSRRVEAFVGVNAFRYLAKERALLNAVTQQLKARPENVLESVTSLMAKLKEAEKQLGQFRQAQLAQLAGELVAGAERREGTTLVVRDIGTVAKVDELRSLATDVRARLAEQSATVVVAGVANGRPMVVAATTEQARARGIKAGQLVRTAAQALGGGGGGKDDLAQGGGSDPAALAAALEEVRRQVSGTGS